MKEKVKFTKCWGGVIKSHILLQDVFLAAEPARAPPTEISSAHWDLENSSQLGWKLLMSTGLQKIPLFPAPFFPKVPQNATKLMGTSLWQTPVFLSFSFAEPYMLPTSIKLLQSSSCIPHHPRSCFHLPQLSFSSAWIISFLSPVVAARDGEGRFLPLSSPCRNAPNIFSLFGSWPMSTLLCLCIFHRGAQRRGELPAQAQEARPAALAPHSMTPLPQGCLPHLPSPPSSQIKPPPGCCQQQEQCAKASTKASREAIRLSAGLTWAKIQSHINHMDTCSSEGRGGKERTNVSCTSSGGPFLRSEQLLQRHWWGTAWFDQGQGAG